jgi:hypothetical protein
VKEIDHQEDIGIHYGPPTGSYEYANVLLVSIKGGKFHEQPSND